MSKQFHKNPRIDRALRHAVRDGMAYSVAAGGGETYFSAFALFFRATVPEVALLTTLPPLIGSLAQLLSAWAGRSASRKSLILVGATVQAVLWLLLLALPLSYPVHAVVLLLLLQSVFYGAGNFGAPQWTSLMRDLVSERRRGRYFGYRTRLTTIMSFSALILCGLILHGFDTLGYTAFGFATIFLIAFLGRAISVYHLTFLYEPEATLRVPAPRIREWITDLRASGALTFSTYFICMNLAVAIASPLFAVYMLRDLEFSYLQFSLNTGTSVIVQFLTLNTWGRIADVFGNRLILIVTSMAIPVMPALWFVSDNFWYLLVLQALSGLSWGGFSLSAGNLLFELLPRTQRIAYLAFHNIAAATAVFLGAMLGALLATTLPTGTTLLGASDLYSSLLYVFLISALARALVAVFGAHRIRQLRPPRRTLSPHALVLRVTGFNAFLGLWYELIGSGAAKAEPPVGDELGGPGSRESIESGDS
jgi:MFS family permease